MTLLYILSTKFLGIIWTLVTSCALSARPLGFPSAPFPSGFLIAVESIADSQASSECVPLTLSSGAMEYSPYSYLRLSVISLTTPLDPQLSV